MSKSPVSGFPVLPETSYEVKDRLARAVKRQTHTDDLKVSKIYVSVVCYIAFLSAGKIGTACTQNQDIGLLSF